MNKLLKHQLILFNLIGCWLVSDDRYIFALTISSKPQQRSLEGTSEHFERICTVRKHSDALFSNLNHIILILVKKSKFVRPSFEVEVVAICERGRKLEVLHAAPVVFVFKMNLNFSLQRFVFKVTESHAQLYAVEAVSYHGCVSVSLVETWNHVV